MKLNKPKEITGVYDNGGNTDDRYTIWITFENGDSYVITANAVASIWSVGENESIDLYSLKYDENYKEIIGETINWCELPYELKVEILDYFDELTFY